MKSKPWEIWLACVMFEDSNESKVRPVLITESGEAFVIGYKITSHAPRNVWGEYSIKSWQAAGLSKQSTIRFSKRLNIPQKDMLRKIGKLDYADRVAALQILKNNSRAK